MKLTLCMLFVAVLAIALAPNAAADTMDSPHVRMGIPESSSFRLPDVRPATPFAEPMPVIDQNAPAVPDDHEFFAPTPRPRMPETPRIHQPTAPVAGPVPAIVTAPEPGSFVLLLVGLAGIVWTFGVNKIGNAS